MASHEFRWARIGLFTLPVYGVLTFLSTLTHQPDPNSDFPAYAEYISTTRFLVGHLIGSIGGTILAFFGVISLFVVLARARSQGLALLGLVLSVIGNAMILTLFGVAAFASPAIGDAYLSGVETIESVNESIYGTPLLVAALIGTFSYAIGAIVFAVAMSRSALAPRWIAVLYGLSGPLISVVGLSIGIAQSVGSLCLIIANSWIVWRVWRQPATGELEDASTAVPQGA